MQKHLACLSDVNGLSVENLAMLQGTDLAILGIPLGDGLLIAQGAADLAARFAVKSLGSSKTYIDDDGEALTEKQVDICVSICLSLQHFTKSIRYVSIFDN